MKNRYESPLSSRYGSDEMSEIFSPRFRAILFRKLWIALARGEKELGLPITDAQIGALEKKKETIDFSLIEAYEKKFRHEVMAHIHAFQAECPEAEGILHIGATSSYVLDNSDLIQMKEAFKLLLTKLKTIIHLLSKKAVSFAKSPCLAYTHYQPAQATTIGKRLALMTQDLWLDAIRIERFIEELPFLGVKGATGTQSSFAILFGKERGKIASLEKGIAAEMGFAHLLDLSGQTYTRKIDIEASFLLTSFAASAHKIGTDVRLLAHDGEWREGFMQGQVGSSAMPHKENPILSERICGLARNLMALGQNPIYTAATQWLERSLDDSSNRRLAIPESFLLADSLMNLLHALFVNLQIDEEKALLNLEREVPHLVLEAILMQGVKEGISREKLHEKLRSVKHLKNLPALAKELSMPLNRLEEMAKKENLVGLAPEQALDFVTKKIDPFLRHFSPSPFPSVDL